MNLCDHGVGGGQRRKSQPLGVSEWPSAVAWESHEAAEVAGQNLPTVSPRGHGGGSQQSTQSWEEGPEDACFSVEGWNLVQMV